MTPWTAARQASLFFTISQSLLKFMSTESEMLQIVSSSSTPFSFCIQPIPAIRSFLNESALCITWPKYWSFIFSPSTEYSGSVFFMIDWSDLLGDQGTLKSLLQHHSSKASAPQHYAFCYGPTCASIHDYWKNHSFDYMVLCLLSDVSAF